ncbi:MAG TPA: hypothetical protein H9667_11095 [Firmicutes bacterium]|nr:hypothetical protein [Bacillota bacterium]
MYTTYEQEVCFMKSFGCVH